MVSINEYSCYICRSANPEYLVSLLPYYLHASALKVDLCENCLETGGFSNPKPPLIFMNQFIGEENGTQ